MKVENKVPGYSEVLEANYNKIQVQIAEIAKTEDIIKTFTALLKTQKEMLNTLQEKRNKIIYGISSSDDMMISVNIQMDFSNLSDTAVDVNEKVDETRDTNFSTILKADNQTLEQKSTGFHTDQLEENREIKKSLKDLKFVKKSKVTSDGDSSSDMSHSQKSSLTNHKYRMKDYQLKYKSVKHLLATYVEQCIEMETRPTWDKVVLKETYDALIKKSNAYLVKIRQLSHLADRNKELELRDRKYKEIDLMNIHLKAEVEFLSKNTVSLLEHDLATQKIEFLENEVKRKGVVYVIPPMPEKYLPEPEKSINKRNRGRKERRRRLRMQAKLLKQNIPNETDAQPSINYYNTNSAPSSSMVPHPVAFTKNLVTSGNQQMNLYYNNPSSLNRAGIIDQHNY